MTRNHADPDGERAVSLLTDLGLTQYEAKCFVALTRVPKGTAKEISRLADVPYSRVYDSVESLQGKGLVDVQPSNEQSQAQEFQAVRTDVAIGTLREKYEARLDSVDETLHGLAAEPNEREQEGIWTISGREHVARRGQVLADGADEEIIILVTEKAVMNDACVQALAMAAERGVDVIAGSEDEAVREELAASVPGTERIEPGVAAGVLAGMAGSIGRVMLVDRSAALVSTLEPGAGESRTETAVWSRGGGPGSGLVTIVRELLLDRIDVQRSGERQSFSGSA